MITTILAYLWVVLFVAAEGRLQKGQPAKTLKAEAADRASTHRLGRVCGLAFSCRLLAPALNYLGIGRILYGPAGWVSRMLSTRPTRGD